MRFRNYDEVKYKIKCAFPSDYDTLKDYFYNAGIRYKQKEGKSLKVSCNKNELLRCCENVGVHPLSIKPCKNNKELVITGYRAHNNLDGQGLQEDYDFISDTNRKLNIAFPDGIKSADDIKAYNAYMHHIDPSGLTQVVFEHSKRRFTDYELEHLGFDDFDNEYDF